VHAVCAVHCFAGLAARVPARKRSALRATSDVLRVVDDRAAITHTQRRHARQFLRDSHYSVVC
jgi:hypothetical protein